MALIASALAAFVSGSNYVPDAGHHTDCLVTASTFTDNGDFWDKRISDLYAGEHARREGVGDLLGQDTSHIRRHEVKVLAAYARHKDLEGPPTESTVIAEFPNMEAAKAWYDFPSYRAVRQHRINGAVYRGTLVAGV